MNNLLQTVLTAGVFVLFIVFIFRFTRKNKLNQKREYDERQITARGKAYRLGFYTLLFYLLALMAAFSFAEKIDLNLLRPYLFLFAFVGLALGADVFAVAAIKNDAYYGLNENIRDRFVLFVVLIAMNFLASIYSFIKVPKSAGFLFNGLAAIFLAVILIASLIHSKKTTKQAEGEE